MTLLAAPPARDTAAGGVLDPARLARLASRVVSGARAQAYAPLAPFTAEPIGTLPLSTPDDVAVAFQAAAAAQRSWARRSVSDRARVLLRFHDLVLEHRDDLLDLVQWETGKARKDALEELLDVAINARYYARTAGRYLRPRRRSGAVPGLTATVEVRHPKGVVGIIAPWNYPLTLAASDALPALVAGNAVVLKPDQQTAFIALYVQDLLGRAGLPEALLQVVVGDGPTIGTAVVDHADYVGFTGSTETGRRVAQRAAARLVGASLELGGKNALLVLADADLERAAEGAVRAAFSNSGQLCVSIERMYVATEVYDAFLARFLRRVDGLRLSASFDFAADMGSLVSEAQLARVRGHVDDAVARGARVLAGGGPRPDVGPLFFAPTVLEGVTREMAVCDEETFGPVVSVYRVSGVDEAVALANGTAYGLNASVWGRDTRRAGQVARRLRAGSVNVNEGYGAAWGSVDAPSGGMGESGLSRRHGAEGIHKYTEVQTVATQRVQGLGRPPFLSDDQWAQTLTGWVRWSKRLGLR